MLFVGGKSANYTRRKLKIGSDFFGRVCYNDRREAVITAKRRAEMDNHLEKLTASESP
jgi:hypothetical protein